MVHGDRIELISMHHEQQAPIGGLMERLAGHDEVAELQVAELAEILVVVSGHQGHERASTRLGEHLAHHIAVELGPVRASLEAPEVDDVPDEVEVFAVVSVEKIEQGLGAALARPQMDVAQPDRAIPPRAHESPPGRDGLRPADTQTSCCGDCPVCTPKGAE